MHTPSENLRGCLYMSAAMFGFAANDLIIKSFTDSLGLGQTILVRGAMASILITLLCLYFGQLRPLRYAFYPIICLRAVSEATATFCFITALFRMPIADVSAIMQTLPLTITLLASVLFHEQIGWRRLSAILVGFGGVLLIIKPGLSGFSVHSAYALGAVAACTVRDLATRRLSGDIPSLFVTLVTTLLVTAMGGAITLTETWQPLYPSQVFGLAIAAIFVLTGYFFAVAAMRVGEIGFVSPFRYSILLFSAAGGVLFYNEIPDRLTLLGSAIVVATGVYTIYRERIVRKQATIPPPIRQ